MDRILRALVVDDSAYVRKVIKQMLGRSPFIDVVGAARSAEEALTLVDELRPDVVTVDLIMPGAGGIGFIRQHMAQRPLPSRGGSTGGETRQLVLDALDAGAIDFIQKPSALATDKVLEMADELIEKVKAAGSVRLSAVTSRPAETPQPRRTTDAKFIRSNLDLIVIGISTGGP